MGSRKTHDLGAGVQWGDPCLTGVVSVPMLVHSARTGDTAAAAAAAAATAINARTPQLHVAHQKLQLRH